MESQAERDPYEFGILQLPADSFGRQILPELPGGAGNLLRYCYSGIADRKAEIPQTSNRKIMRSDKNKIVLNCLGKLAEVESHRHGHEQYGRGKKDRNKLQIGENKDQSSK